MSVHDYDDPDIYGVVVGVYCSATNRFLILRELKDKPVIFKRKGMLAFPSETRDLEDADVLATFRRAGKEEVGLERIADDDIFIREQPLESLPHSVRVYGGWITVTEEFIPTGIDETDVEYVGWMTEAEIRRESQVFEQFRHETIPTLDIIVRVRGGANA